MPAENEVLPQSQLSLQAIHYVILILVSAFVISFVAFLFVWQQLTVPLGAVNSAPTITQETTVASVNATTTPVVVTMPQTFSGNLLYLSNGDIWQTKNGSEPVQFSHTNGTVHAFVVDARAQLVYYTTFNANIKDEILAVGNTIFVCSLMQAQCNATIAYQENSGTSIGEMNLSKDGAFLAYDVYRNVNAALTSFTTNTHIVNLETKQAMQWAQQDHTGAGIPDVLFPDWLANGYMRYLSGVDGISLAYGVHVNTLAYTNTNLGDETPHEVSVLHTVRSVVGKPGMEEDLGLQILSVTDTKALILWQDTVGSKVTSFIGTISLKSLDITSFEDVDKLFDAVGNSAVRVSYVTLSPDQQLVATSEDSKGIYLVFCSQSICDLKTVSKDYTSVKDISSTVPRDVAITKDLSLHTYTFINGMRYIVADLGLTQNGYATSLKSRFFQANGNTDTVGDGEKFGVTGMY